MDPAQPDYSAMTDQELCNMLGAGANPTPPGAPAAFIDWLPLVLECLKRILERSAK